MKLSTLPSWHKFENQAALILEASKAKRGDGLRMEDVDGDEDEGAPGDEDEQDPDDEGDDTDAEDDPDEEPDDDKKGKSKDKKDKSDDEPVTRAEYERVKRHRAAADRRVAERDQTIADLQSQLRDKDTKADGATKTRVTELESQNGSLSKQITDLRIQNAFLAANEFDWHDPADALRLADLSGVEIDPDDGTVTGVKDALKALAKSKPHLIKKVDKTDPKGSSGSPNNGRRKGETKKPDRATLAKTYPVLAGR